MLNDRNIILNIQKNIEDNNININEIKETRNKSTNGTHNKEKNNIQINQKLNEKHITKNKIQSKQIIDAINPNSDIANILNLKEKFKSLTSKEKAYPNELSIFEKIFNNLAHNLENASEIYEKITEYIAEDFKQSPQKEIDLNLDTLAEQTKYVSAVKYLLNNKELEKIIHALYKEDNLDIQRRRKISKIYNNLTKNTYNVDSIIQEDPELIKTLVNKVSKQENSIKEKENMDIADNELTILSTIVKDDSNFAQVKEKNLITKDDLTNCINIYKGNEDKSISDNVKDLEEIVEKMTTKEKEPEKKEEASSFKVDTAILDRKSVV